MRKRGPEETGRGPSDGFSIPGRGGPASASAFIPKPWLSRSQEKLGHARSVLTWFFARKGTAEPHFSINTFCRSLAATLGRSLAWTGALSTGPGLTQKRRDVPTAGTERPDDYSSWSAGEETCRCAQGHAYYSEGRASGSCEEVANRAGFYK